MFAALGLQFASMVFPDLVLQNVYVLVLVGLICGFVAHGVAGQALRLRVSIVMGLFVVIIVGGVAISAITVNNAMWWEQSFSFLGEQTSRSRIFFNTTMITSGILLLVLQQFLMSDFVYLARTGSLSPRWLRWIRGGLIVLGIALAMVGIIPFGVSPTLDTIHDLSAYSIAVILLVFMLASPRLLPQLPRPFFVTTALTVVLLVIAVVLHFVGSINTVGIELLAFAIGGTWLILFVKNVELLVEESPQPLT